jgi:hypothetical protein
VASLALIRVYAVNRQLRGFSNVCGETSTGSGA